MSRLGGASCCGPINRFRQVDALASIGRRTDDPTREAIKGKLQTMSHADRLVAVVEGEEQDDAALGRIFGEELRSGLVLAE